MKSHSILEARGLVKEFRGFTAVDHVDLTVKRGTIHALIGPNGAGKTTCFNLLTKFIQPTAGSIFFEGADVTHDSPTRVARRGIIRSFQISATFPQMSVLENIRVALQARAGIAYDFFHSSRRLERFDARCLDYLRRVGLAELAHQPAYGLAYGRKRALEIATTMAMEPSLMLLDEPTQGMGHEDVASITELIREAAKSCTVLMVEHNMDVVSRIADTITVLQFGQIIAEGDYGEVSRNPRVLEAYMGVAA